MTTRTVGSHALAFAMLAMMAAGCAGEVPDVTQRGLIPADVEVSPASTCPGEIRLIWTGHSAPTEDARSGLFNLPEIGAAEILLRGELSWMSGVTSVRLRDAAGETAATFKGAADTAIPGGTRDRWFLEPASASALSAGAYSLDLGDAAPSAEAMIELTVHESGMPAPAESVLAITTIDVARRPEGLPAAMLWDFLEGGAGKTSAYPAAWAHGSFLATTPFLSVIRLEAAEGKPRMTACRSLATYSSEAPVGQEAGRIAAADVDLAFIEPTGGNDETKLSAAFSGPTGDWLVMTAGWRGEAPRGETSLLVATPGETHRKPVSIRELEDSAATGYGPAVTESYHITGPDLSLWINRTSTGFAASLERSSDWDDELPIQGAAVIRKP